MLINAKILVERIKSFIIIIFSLIVILICFASIIYGGMCYPQQKSNFVVIPKNVVYIYNNQNLSPVDIFKCDTTIGGRWVYSTNLLKYYPQIVSRIMDSLQLSQIDSEYLSIDSFPHSINISTLGK